MKTIGIVAHSAEGGALCFQTACREGQKHLGEHMHPTVTVSCIPMGLSMPGWESDEHEAVGKYLAQGVQQVADSGADFYVCPDNTAHIVLEKIADRLPLPGLHIAEVVCHEINQHGWQKVGLLGTKWTMTGPVYQQVMEKQNLQRLIPEANMRERLNNAIFDELCPGIFDGKATGLFLHAIEDLKARGAECVILGCTEIPLIITPDNSPLPVLDSTRLLAKYAVLESINKRAIGSNNGWLPLVN